MGVYVCVRAQLEKENTIKRMNASRSEEPSMNTLKGSVEVLLVL